MRKQVITPTRPSSFHRAIDRDHQFTSSRFPIPPAGSAELGGCAPYRRISVKLTIVQIWSIRERRSRGRPRAISVFTHVLLHGKPHPKGREYFIAGFKLVDQGQVTGVANTQLEGFPVRLEVIIPTEPHPRREWTA
jgi:hypothetical protein